MRLGALVGEVEECVEGILGGGLEVVGWEILVEPGGWVKLRGRGERRGVVEVTDGETDRCTG